VKYETKKMSKMQKENAGDEIRGNEKLGEIRLQDKRRVELDERHLQKP